MTDIDHGPWKWTHQRLQNYYKSPEYAAWRRQVNEQLLSESAWKNINQFFGDASGKPWDHGFTDDDYRCAPDNYAIYHSDAYYENTNYYVLNNDGTSGTHRETDWEKYAYQILSEALPPGPELAYNGGLDDTYLPLDFNDPDRVVTKGEIIAACIILGIGTSQILVTIYGPVILSAIAPTSPSALQFTQHAAQRLAERGIDIATVSNIMQTGIRTAGRDPGTWVYSQAISGTRIHVVWSETTNKIVTVFFGR